MTASLLTARDRDTIRAALLSRLADRYRGDAVKLDDRRGSDAWQETAALAVILSGIEAHAAGAVGQLLPDLATGGTLTSHGTVGEITRGATESTEDYRARVLAWWRERLPTCSEGDLVALAEATDACTQACVYRRLQPATAATYTAGCWTMVACGAPQGSSATNTRVLAAGDLAHVAAYIEGTEDEHGVATSGVQQRPVCGLVGNYSVEACSTLATDVALALTNAPTHPFPWAGSHAIVGSAVGWVTVAGDQSALAGLPMLAHIGTANARGGYVRVPILTAVFGGVNTTLTFDALAAAPTGTIHPCPPNFEQVRDATFALFDALGPGDTGAPSRWPSPSTSWPSVLYRVALRAAAMRAEGVRDVTDTAPGADVTPAAKTIATLRDFLVTA